MGAGLGMMMPSILKQAMGGQPAPVGPPVVCSKCHAEISETARFCPMCGHQIVVVNRCLKCGKDLPVEARFCMVCGEKVEKAHARCPHCGKDALPEAVYCNHCGEKI